MAQPSLSSTARPQTSYADVPVRTGAVGNEALASGVSWPAVAGGAFVTAALSIILLALGAGLGLSSVSPWSNVGASASAISTAAIVWLIFMQIASGAMGGYLAGRLRDQVGQPSHGRSVFPRHRPRLLVLGRRIRGHCRILDHSRDIHGRCGRILGRRRRCGGWCPGECAGSRPEWILCGRAVPFQQRAARSERRPGARRGRTHSRVFGQG